MKIQNYERQLFGTFSRKSTKSCVHYIFISTRHSETLFEAKTSEFRCEMNF